MTSRALTRASRLKRIEELLLSAPGGYTTPELAAHLGVDRSTVWRDLQELSGEVPLIEENQRYRINRSEYLSNVRLGQGESLALYLAMRHMIRRTTHLPPVMISGLQKLSIVLRDPLAAQLADSIVKAEDNKKQEPERAKVWEVLVTGWLDQITVRIEYLKFNEAERRAYELQPYFFEPAVLSEGVYVVGHSLSHQTLRTFKVERILRASLTTQQFTRPTDIDLDVLLRHAWGIWYGEAPVEVRLRFRYPASRRVCETLWHPLQQIEELSDGSIEWRVQVAGTTELIPWIRGWGSDCEVLAPVELRQYIAEDMRRAAEQYQREE